MDIKFLPKVPNIPFSIRDDEPGFVRAIFNHILASNQAVNNLIEVSHPETLTDAAAKDNSIYFSSTASKLVYKDKAGVVHALY